MYSVKQRSLWAAACHQGGRNVVISEKTLDKAALEQYLDGGFNVEAITYQVSTAGAGVSGVELLDSGDRVPA